MALPTVKEDKDENLALQYFSNEETELNKAIQEIDELYDEVKTHYDMLKQASRTANGGKGILTFIEKQTSNLVQLKNSKASLINNKITMKKYAADLALKEKKDTDDTKVNVDLVNAVIKQLESNDENVIISEVEDDNESLSEEELLEQRVLSLQESGDIPADDEEVEGDVEEGLLVVQINGKKWSFAGINEEGKVIKNFPVPNKKDYKMKLKRKKDGSMYAMDQDEKIYRVIEK